MGDNTWPKKVLDWMPRRRTRRPRVTRMKGSNNRERSGRRIWDAHRRMANGNQNTSVIIRNRYIHMYILSFIPRSIKNKYCC
jgi:hypothetical protein